MPKRRRKGPQHAYNPNNDPKNIPAMRERMWKKGQSGNPKGGPPRVSLEAIVERMLDEKIGRGKDAITRREALATVLVDEMINRRNVPMIRDVLQRIWPTVQKVDFNATGQLVIQFDDQDRREMEAGDEGEGRDDGE